MELWIAPKLTGGLGNRLFQYAAAAGLAERSKRRLVFFLPVCKETGHGDFNNIFNLFPEVPLISEGAEWLHLDEEIKDLYTFIPFPELHENTQTVVTGYRQSFMYFPTTDINLNFESALGVARCVEISRTIPHPETTWFLHVRLGDYLKCRHHWVNLENYYRLCVSQIPRGHTLILFSDDVELCREKYAMYCEIQGLNFLTSVYENELESLYLMSLCKGGAILANSTFSWWGGYLAHQNGAARVFYPNVWGEGLPQPTHLIPPWGFVVDVNSLSVFHYTYNK